VEPVTFLASPDPASPPGLRLAARLYLPADHEPDRPGTDGLRSPGLIVGHGAGSRASRHEQFCLEACRGGFVVLALDFRGHGDSEGRADGPLHLDLLAAAGFMRAQASVDPRRVCYRGSSMGGFYGIKAAAAARFAAMVLLCPASGDTMLRSLAEGEDHYSRGDTEDPDAHPPTSATRWDTRRLHSFFEAEDSLGLVREVACPVLLVHARGDETVPIQHSLSLAERLHTETTILLLEGGSHTSAQHDVAVHAYCVAWLRGKVAR
jgi:dipeptidyl aminopeptidase/acylaminoacyl peptidase